MPVSNNKRKNGKVKTRNTSVDHLDDRVNGFLKIMSLMSRATKGLVDGSTERNYVKALQLGL